MQLIDRYALIIAIINRAMQLMDSCNGDNQL